MGGRPTEDTVDGVFRETRALVHPMMPFMMCLTDCRQEESALQAVPLKGDPDIRTTGMDRGRRQSPRRGVCPFLGT